MKINEQREALAFGNLRVRVTFATRIDRNAIVWVLLPSKWSWICGVRAKRSQCSAAPVSPEQFEAKASILGESELGKSIARKPAFVSDCYWVILIDRCGSGWTAQSWAYTDGRCAIRESNDTFRRSFTGSESLGFSVANYPVKFWPSADTTSLSTAEWSLTDTTQRFAETTAIDEFVCLCCNRHPAMTNQVVWETLIWQG